VDGHPARFARMPGGGGLPDQRYPEKTATFSVP